MLLLTRANIPLDVKTVITGSKLLYNPSDLIPFQNIGIYKSILGVFYFDLSNPTFEPLELKSDSTVYNSSSFFVSLALFLIGHCILRTLNGLFKKWETNNIWKICISTCSWILNKTLLIMTYGYYIRFIMQTNQFLLISSMNEIYTLHTTSTPKILSLIFAFFVLFACFSLVGIVMYLSISSYEVKEGEHNKIGEFYSGVRMKIKAKLYVTFLIIRRTLFVIILICLASIPSKSMIWILGYLISL